MCRLIAAIGLDASVPLKPVLDAARALARGGSMSHERPEMSHTAGWGYVLRREDAPHFDVYRSGSSILDDPAVDELTSVRAGMILIHLRNSSANNLSGTVYAHPQSYQPSAVQWHILHNGSMPGLAARMGAAAAHFDTANYIRYAVPSEGDRLDGEALLRKLDDVPDSTAANAFIVNENFLYVVNHYPQDTAYPRFYTIHRAKHDGVLYIVSEAVTSLAPADAWTAALNRSVIEINLARVFGHKEAA